MILVLMRGAFIGATVGAIAGFQLNLSLIFTILLAVAAGNCCAAGAVYVHERKLRKGAK